MKTTFYIFLLICMPLLAFSQVHVTPPNGHVGIGTDAPTQKLDVNGNIRIGGTSLFFDSVNSFRFSRNNGTSQILHHGNAAFQIRNVDNAIMDFYTNNALRARIHRDGRFQIWSGTALKPGGGTWMVSSDKRLKRDITSYEKGLDELLQVNPVSFYYLNDFYKNADNEEHVGVVAQELKKVVPTMVGDFEMVDEEGELKGKYLSVDPNEFTYMLINAVKEQQTLIEELRQEVAELKDMVENGSSRSGSSRESIELEGRQASLKQNTPNPFSSRTLVEYYLPTDTKKAAIQVYDSNGQQIYTKSISGTGKGNIEIEAGTIPVGTYNYSLVINGEVIDTRQMVIVK